MVFPVHVVTRGAVPSLGVEPWKGAGTVSAATAMETRAGRIPGWLGGALSTDHKRIGLNLGLCSLAFFLVGGVFALLMRAQIAQPNEHFVSDNTYNELFTMHGSTMIYLFVTPMAIALGAVSGAAADRGGRHFRSARRAGRVLDVALGWADHAERLVDRHRSGAGRLVRLHAAVQRDEHARGRARICGPLGVLLAAIGMLLMAACVVATIARRRAPGMSLLRMPVFTWTALVSMLMVVGAFPVLILAMALLYIDRLGGHIFTGSTGRSTTRTCSGSSATRSST